MLLDVVVLLDVEVVLEEVLPVGPVIPSAASLILVRLACSAALPDFGVSATARAAARSPRAISLAL